MITSIAFAISTTSVSAAHTPTVEITPALTTKGDMDFEIKVTNTGGDPITSVDVDLPFAVDGWVGTLTEGSVVSTSGDMVLPAGTGILIDPTYGLTLAEGTPITLGKTEQTVKLLKTGTSTAEWKTTPVPEVGDYSVELLYTAGTDTEYAAVEVTPPSGITVSDLSDISDTSFWYYVALGNHGPLLELRFRDPNGDPTTNAGHVDITVNTAELVPKTAWHEEIVDSSSTATCYGNDGKGDGFWDGNWNTVGDGISTGTMTLSALETALDDLSNTKEWDGSKPATWELTRVQVQLGYCGSDENPVTAYIDDITIDGTLYSVEPSGIDIVAGITVIVPAGTVTDDAKNIIMGIAGTPGTSGTSAGTEITISIDSPIDLSTYNRIKLAVDLGGAFEIAIAGGSYTDSTSLVNAINTAIDATGTTELKGKVTASWTQTAEDTGYIVFTSDTVGPESSVAVTSGTAGSDAAPTLGFSPSADETTGTLIVTLLYETRVTLDGVTYLVKPGVKLPDASPVILPAETEIELTETIVSSLPKGVILASDTHAVLGDVLGGVNDAKLCEDTEGKIGPGKIEDATLISETTCPLVAENTVNFPYTSDAIKVLKGTKVVLTISEDDMPIGSEIELGADTVKLWGASTAVLDAEVSSVTMNLTAEFTLPNSEATATLTNPGSDTITLPEGTEIVLPAKSEVTLGATAGTSVGAKITTFNIVADKNITLTVDGTEGTYAIPVDDYPTGAALATAISTAISGATASWETDHIVFTSDTVGPDSSVHVDNTSSAAEVLGFSSPTEKSGTGTVLSLLIPDDWEVATISEDAKTVTWENTTADGAIGSGESLPFSIRVNIDPNTVNDGKYLWTVMTTDAEGKMVNKPLTTTVDGTEPTILKIAMEPDMVGVGSATIKVVASEKLSTLDNVYCQIDDNEDHVGDPTKLISMGSADGITWKGTLPIPGDGLWDDNRVDIVVLAALTKDMASNTPEKDNDVNIHSTTNRHIDTISPLLPANLEMTYKTPFDNQVNQKSQLITGTAQDNIAGEPTDADNLTVKISVGTTPYETKSFADGTFASEINLAEGPNTVKVWVIDELGNIGPENVQTVFLDSLKPTISMESVADKTYKDGIPVNDNTPTVVLTIKDPGYSATALGIEYDDITVTLENADGDPIEPPLENATPWNNTTGRFENTIPLTMGDFTAGLPDGSYSIVVTATDVLNNSNEATFKFEVDTIAPDVPTVPLGSVLHLTTAVKPYVTRESSVSVSGEGVSGDTVNIYLDDETTPTETAKVTTADMWSAKISLTGGHVTRISVSETDVAGNESAKEVWGYAMSDASAPAVTLAKLPETTDSTSIVLSGTVKKDSWESWSDITLTLQLGTGQVTVPITEVSVNEGSYNYSLSLAEGSNTIVVQAVDEAGNPSDVAHATVERTVTPWGIYAIILVIIALVMAAVAIFRKSVFRR